MKKLKKRKKIKKREKFEKCGISAPFDKNSEFFRAVVAHLISSKETRLYIHEAGCLATYAFDVKKKSSIDSQLRWFSSSSSVAPVKGRFYAGHWKIEVRFLNRKVRF